MDASTLLAIPTSPPATGLQVFALFINFFFPALALLVVSVRVAGRVAASQFAVDDWLVCIAMLMSVAETVISFFFIKTNFIGIPPERVPHHDPTQGLIWSYAVQILYNPILALVKSSVLIFLTRLFGQKNWIRRFLLWVNVANVSQMVAVFFAIILQCTPVAFNWDPTIPGGYCVDRRALYISTAVFNIATDFLILGLPLYIFSGLRIPKRTKIALLVVFLMGFLVTITSIIRLVILVQGLFMLSIFPNAASNNVGFVTSAIETNLALITASAPALRPIFRSRDRGGWFARSVMATANRPVPDNNNNTPSTVNSDPSSSAGGYYRDLEAGRKSTSTTTFDRDKETSPIITSNLKFGRGGSRNGRKGNTSRSHRTGSRSRSGSHSNSNGNRVKPTIIRIKTDRHDQREMAELRSSPRPSEERVMTSNGIVRVSDIQREIDGIVRDLGVSREGGYTSGGTSGSGRVGDGVLGMAGGTTSGMAIGVGVGPTTPKTPRVIPMSMARSRPSMETITVGATLVTPLPPSASSRPGTSGSGVVVRRGVPERYYSESIYPEQGFAGRNGDNEDDDDDDRVSRYLDRRFGVVTPKGTTPTSKGWEESGRPF